MTVGIKIEMVTGKQGVATFINRLEKFDKEVSKELKKGMREGSKHVIKEAKRRLDAVKNPPLSNWGYSWVEQDRAAGRNLIYNKADAKRGLKVGTFRARKKGRTVGFGFQAIQKNPAASIFEMAGSDNPNGSPRSRKTGRGSYTFNQNINRDFKRGPIPRILYPAYYAGMPEARKDIDAALQKARKRVGL